MTNREIFISTQAKNAMQENAIVANVVAAIKGHSAVLIVDKALPLLANGYSLYNAILRLTGYCSVSIVFIRGVSVLTLKD